MSWYNSAQAFEPKTLEDRNVLNEKIRFFNDIADNLERLSKVVFQDGYFAKESSFNMATDKKMSSHPKLRDMLLEADKIALDSPWKFATLCLDCTEMIRSKVASWERERKELTEDGLPRRMKGWVDKHAR